jgi:hypothetical protein
MKKLKILMFDMILHFKFIYSQKKITIVIVQTIHLIMLSFNLICIYDYFKIMNMGYM